jgi:hypothetical protein
MDVQQDLPLPTCVRVTEATTRRVGRRRYHNLHNVHVCSYSVALQYGAARLAEATTRQDGATHQVTHRVAGLIRRDTSSAARTIITLHRYLMP